MISGGTMRKLFLAGIALFAAGLACQLPNLGDVQGTVGVVQKTIAAGMTDLPGTIAAAMTESAVPDNGTIRGHLSYPSEFLPAQRVVAFDAATMAKVAEVSTVEGQNTFEMTVPAGDYYVVAYTLDGKLSAGYSQAVPCGLSADCTDHSLITVRVDAGAVVENIDPQDWYAPADAFPPMP
jgi:hypothetical protein